MFLPARFADVQDFLSKHYGQRPFTMDACANPDGSNALCSNFCSTDQSFLKSDLAGQHVWINPPFTQHYDFVDHYVKQKSEHPEISACILVPCWNRIRHQALSSMVQVKHYRAGTRLFSRPDESGNRVSHAWYPVGRTNFVRPTG